jgi:hypothetical protein
MLPGRLTLLADPIELTQLNKIAAMCKQITTDNGYYKTIREVNKGDVGYESGARLPRINILIGGLDYANSSKNESHRLLKNRAYILDVYYEANNLSEAQSEGIKLLADLEIRFFDNTPNGNTNYNQTANAHQLENTCLVVLPAAVTFWETLENQNVYNFELEIAVYSRQNARNPSQMLS